MDPWLRRVLSKAYNVVIRRASDIRCRDFGCNFSVIEARLIRAGEFGPFKPIRPIYVYLNARRFAEVPVSHHRRKHGRSAWTLAHLSAYAVDNLLGTSERPFLTLGVLCFIPPLLYLSVSLLQWLMPSGGMPAFLYRLLFQTNVLSLTLTIAVILVLGEFVSRNYLVPRHPTYVIRSVRRH